ncbi:MBL fold metallo-hydrolase [Plebeiibacterium marinum]|uniref:MBL fold metallo-hydrolase n=1 Tax=Plebeiibacterium marinum TaxID=2992111 RepID=A0AAE3ME66_9BACT|nr:MBL fold metallo-hydrolase [Plebeiobacterium marinum]MCW3806134.1 MBL fold metallo-hydrolase [Plebeiobacterium marinum]
MQITILSENTAGGSYLAEHGLSYLIEFLGINILLDTGHSDVFLKNATKMNLDLKNKVDFVVLSHGHWDHGGGLEYITGKKLITHPDAFIKRYRVGGTQDIGLPMTKKELEQKFDLILSSKPYQIAKNVLFMGSIPRLNDFEAKATPFENERHEPDFVPDDSALVFIQDNELVIVTGCSHSGICNIVEYAKKTTGISKVSGVIGGFHLKHNNKQTQQTISHLKREGIKNIYPTHCTALPALAAFYEHFKIEQVKTGMVISI